MNCNPALFHQTTASVLLCRIFLFNLVIELSKHDVAISSGQYPLTNVKLNALSLNPFGMKLVTG